MLFKSDFICISPIDDQTRQWIDDGHLNLIQERIRELPFVINRIDTEGYTLLAYAAFRGQLDIVEALIDAGADINASNDLGFQKKPLFVAAEQNHHHIIKTLLFHGAHNPFSREFGLRLALDRFKRIDNVTLWTLIEKKQYQYNPHRHVKIWLSNKPSVFMNETNQWRLVQMRAGCPDDEINLLYDSQLLLAQAHQELRRFCDKHDLRAVDVRDIIPLCNKDTERQLITIYEDEITHLDAGGNLAAASDILRWLKPVYSLGTYSDFDVKISTKGLPKTIPVFAEILFNLGSLFEQNQLLFNNDIIAVLNLDSKKITKIHQFIIASCAPATKAPKSLGDFSDTWFLQNQHYHDCFKKMQALYLLKTPRQWRENIPVFMALLQGLVDVVYGSTEIDAAPFVLPIPTDISRLFRKCYGNREQLEQKIYMSSVIDSTGPTVLTSVFGAFNSLKINYEISAYSFSLYGMLFNAFSSSMAMSMNMTEGQRQSMTSGDLSWMPIGQQCLLTHEGTLHEHARKIQRSWLNHVARTHRPEQSSLLMSPIHWGCLVFLMALGGVLLSDDQQGVFGVSLGALPLGPALIADEWLQPVRSYLLP